MDYYGVNKKRWDELVGIHANSDEYDLDGFLSGKNSLHELEMEILGDVRGKSLLHLQCHFGLDTISWSRLGAEATGIDFSDTAIELARELALKTNVNTKFVCSNVYDLRDNLSGQFDIVFTSIGVLCWLQDMGEWANIISHFLKPGGTFLLVESHPFIWVFDDEGEELSVRYSYWHTEEPMEWSTDGSYAGKDAIIENKKSYEWQHTMSEIINSLIKAGLTIEQIGEYPQLPWQYVKKAVKTEDNCYRISGDPLPQMWSVKAKNPYPNLQFTDHTS